MSAREFFDIGSDLVRREADYLDHRRWDDWLALYWLDCTYWVPTWRSEESLTEDPQSEVSHIYYASRAGLEDRIVRIRSRRSPASLPLRRTVHTLGNLLLGEHIGETFFDFRTAWLNHVFDPHRKTDYALYGHTDYRMEYRGGDWKVARKKIVIQNDYLPSMIDIYCL